QDVLAELLAVLEVELVLPALLDGHGELEAACLGLGGDVGRGAELLVHQRTGDAGLRAALQRVQKPLENNVLAVRDALDVLGCGVARQAEPLLLEGAAMV